MLIETTEHRLKLIQELKDAASDLSYYNAAEGDSYRAEAAPRAAARARLEEAREKCRAEGIDPSEALKGGSYLL